MTDKYCGNGKVIKTDTGSFLSVLMSSEDVQTLQESLVNGFVSVNVSKRREPSKKGYTHYLKVNEWKPDPEVATAEDCKL